MAVLRLPGVAELRDRVLFPLGDEDRVVAEAAGAPALGRDPALERALGDHLVALRREGDDRRAVAAAPCRVLHARELAEQLLDVRVVARVLAGVARGEDARRARQRVDLEPRVLAGDPDAG